MNKNISRRNIALKHMHFYPGAPELSIEDIKEFLSSEYDDDGLSVEQLENMSAEELEEYLSNRG